MSLTNDIRDIHDRQRAILEQLREIKDRTTGDQRQSITRAISLAQHTLKHLRAAR